MNTTKTNSNWNTIYQLGAAAAIGAVLVGIIEILITFLPGGNSAQETVLDWFQLFQDYPFMGLRNLGLLNIFLNILAIFTYLALYGAHRKTAYKPLAALAAIISYLGIAVFFATNRAFAMLDLSVQYAAATSEIQRSVLEAAGQALLSVGASHSPGTFLAFFLVESAGVLISYVMLRGEVFPKAAAYAGMLGFSILLLFEFLASFFSGLSQAAMLLSMVGGLLSMVWYILIARRLFQIR
ncbi:MAG: hypothetical protein ACK2U1_23280 [Anaerolineales bacterium]